MIFRAAIRRSRCSVNVTRCPWESDPQVWRACGGTRENWRWPQAAGFDALILTVDTAVTSNREYNLRNGMQLPFRFNRRNVLDVLAHPRWLFGVLARYLLTTGMPRYENYPAELRKQILERRMARHRRY